MQTSLNIKTVQDTYRLVEAVATSKSFAKKAPSDYKWVAAMAEKIANRSSRSLTDKEYAVTFGILRRQAHALVKFGIVKPSDDSVKGELEEVDDLPF